MHILKTISKYVTLINRFIRSRVMAETLKLKKRGFGFFENNRVKCSNIFKNGNKLHTHTASYLFVYELQ